MGRGICTVCERFFNKEHVSQVKCKECHQKDEDDYAKVRGYLELHEGATISDVMKDTGISMGSLNRFIGERRVYIVNNRLTSE